MIKNTLYTINTDENLKNKKWSGDNMVDIQDLLSNKFGSIPHDSFWETVSDVHAMTVALLHGCAVAYFK